MSHCVCGCLRGSPCPKVVDPLTKSKWKGGNKRKGRPKWTSNK